MSKESFESLVSFCKENQRICPNPQKWNELWKILLEKQRQENMQALSPPLILAAWWDTPAISKIIRFEEHIKWADENGALNQISTYLRNLSESDWFHFGD